MVVALGDRIAVGGGYYDDSWTGVSPFVTGEVVAWNPGQNTRPACVVLLDEPLTARGDHHGAMVTQRGTHVVLELRLEGHEWDDEGVVHVELCDGMPEPVRWQDREGGLWVEGAASYRKLSATT